MHHIRAERCVCGVQFGQVGGSVNWLRGLFRRKRQLVCGGRGCIAVCDDLGREVAHLYYRRPDSSEVLDYAYEQYNVLGGSESQLREIQAEDEKQRLKKMHRVLERDFWLVWAEKIFDGADGYKDTNGGAIDALPVPEQFVLLKKYHAHNLVDMTALAFERSGGVKKKD